MREKSILTGLCILILFIAVHQSFAQVTFNWDYFEKTNFTLSESPEICAAEPSDPSFPNIGQSILQQTEYAIIDWKTKLNQGLGKHPIWNMDLIKITPSQQSTFDFSKCDIGILYKPQPTNSQYQYEAVGLTQYNFTIHKALITIYYEQLDMSRSVTESSDAKYNYYKYNFTPYYTGRIADDTQIGMTIRHELGHAFGLGHYIVSPEELQRWVQGIGNPTSIMIKVVAPIGFSDFSITPTDVQELKSLYGSNGFNLTRAIKVEQDPIQSLKDKIKDNVQHGFISDFYFRSAFMYFRDKGLIHVNIDNGHSSMPSWFGKVINWWANGNISNEEFASAIQFLLDKNILQV